MIRDEFLKALTVKQETINLDSIDMEVTIKEPTIAQSEQLEKTRKKVLNGEATNQDLIIEACRYSMVNPSFFTDEELENLSAEGMGILLEIYMKLPMIGKTDEEKKQYTEILAKSINDSLSNVLSQEEVEKKPKKKKDSSLN